MKQEINKNIQKTMLFINIFIIIYAIVIFIFKNTLTNLIPYINIAIFMLLTFFSVILLGYKKNKKTRDKIRINNIFIIISTLYLITIYLASCATGTIKNQLNILNIIYLITFMIISEIERYILLSKSNKKNNQIYKITLAYILIDIFVLSSITPLNLTIENLLITTIISIVKNSLLSYTSSKFGFYPCFIYSLITFVFPSILPIYPMLGNYLTIVFFVIYSIIIYYNISKPLRKEEEESYNKYKKGIGFYLERIFLVLVVITILLVSGEFHYTISAIASDSMYPALKRGDAIIIEKTTSSNIDSLKKGMIIAFKEGEEIITHRIISIEMIEGEEYIITKGDNNSTKDVTKKRKDDIIGIVKYKIPLIGYPSIEISEIKNK